MLVVRAGVSGIFQSTLPRRERLRLNSFTLDVPFISIHAPAKGATLIIMIKVIELEISIHAPAKGATAMVLMVPQIVQISIHAPAKGATSQCPSVTVDGKPYFNPRSREGSDCIALFFSSTALNFNPRSREGSDV